MSSKETEGLRSEMAAYAALNSLMHVLELIDQHHPRPPITLEKEEIESLCGHVCFLQEFLENYSHGGGCSEEIFESQIRDAAHAAEDIIESHVVDQIVAGEKSSDYNLFCQDLQKITEYMDLIKKDVIKTQQNRGTTDHLPRNISTSAGSSTPTPTKKNIMVGFDDVLVEIMDRLTGQGASRQILPIVGMGGIGKTTLARNVYDNPFIVQRFQIRVWVTISQEYRLRDILLGALFCVTKTESDENLAKFSDNFSETSEDEIGGQLYKSLYGRRYLVIMDDMWSIDAWDMVKFFFPDGDNGSRIMITTRLSNVSNHFGSCGVKMNFLNEEKSWDLFRKTVFPQDPCCPQELEETGMKIAINCKGLPLSIVVIGGLLANSEKTLEHWEYVAENLSKIVNLEDDEHCLKILSLSYTQLPVHLKPCFLYMGIFPEDREIHVSWLIKLWIAEGILKPIKAKSLEMVAEQYLKDLMDRNLILVRQLGSRGTIKFCIIHDLLRDLCLREAYKEKFLCVTKAYDFDEIEGIHSQRRICIHQSTSEEEYLLNQAPHALPQESLTRSLICDINGVLSSVTPRLLRVFKSVDKYLYVEGNREYSYSLEEIFQLVNSRYLAFTAVWNSSSIFPSSIHLLWNLQSLIVKGTWGEKIVAPPEIWEMSQLRHLEFGNISLPDLPNVPVHEGDRDFILRNLHTLRRIRNFKLSEEVIRRIPNIKKLDIYYDDFSEGWWHKYCVDNLVCLNKLESLALSFEEENEPWDETEFPESLPFPHSLKKLTLHDTSFLWEDMTMIGSLPHLEVLKLCRESFYGPEWNPVEDEFPSLKFLLIECCNDLVYWNADSTHFPCLERLVLEEIDKLKEIPLDIGEIPTLQSIELICCSESAVISAKKILDEQENLGNEGLQVRAFLGRENAELEGLASDNFQVQTY